MRYSPVSPPQDLFLPYQQKDRQQSFLSRLLPIVFDDKALSGVFILFILPAYLQLAPLPNRECCGLGAYCRLCLAEESEENLRARYAIILKQREEAYKRVEEAKATAKYMDDKAAQYAALLAGPAPDDTNPKNWTAANRPKHKAEKL